MHYAEQLLLTGRYTISEVGYMVSMSSQSYFRKCFKDEFHVNPSDYQKQVKS
jgi:AraC-like DNA-binding protein